MSESSNSAESQFRHQKILNKNLRTAAANAANHTTETSTPVVFQGRWSRKQWAHASLFATVGALLAAMLPGFSNDSAANVPEKYARRTTMSLTLPPMHFAKSNPLPNTEQSWQIASVEKGETFSHMLERLNISKQDQKRLLAHEKTKTNLSRLKPGTELSFDLDNTGKLRGLRYDEDKLNRIVLDLSNDDKIIEKEIQREFETRNAVISGKVGKSLFHSARKLGLSAKAVNTLTDEIFKYDIDFNQDVGQNDRFSVVVEQTWREGELIETGPVLAATFTSRGKVHSGFRFQRDGKTEYFTADGRPLKKSFIRMPIAYARITSNFGARRHPILGKMRGHMGVDYGAPSGTPIMAAGDAKVQFAGWKGGYGKTVILDHGSGHTTLYAHMSSIGSIRPGQRVNQGTVIGRVGSTGMSTGPHLHYEFRINGVHRNPLSVTMPPPAPLSGTALAQFRSQVGPTLARINRVENIIFADVDNKDKKQLASVSKDKKGKTAGSM